MVVGDSLTALSAIDALRMNFTGSIILIPVSQYGAFENTDIMLRKLGPLTKTELYLLEEDFLNRANVVVMKGKINYIDLENKFFTITGNNK